VAPVSARAALISRPPRPPIRSSFPLAPQQFARLWIHTHPGACPEPSFTDEQTFARVFGGCDWSVMFILAKGGASYARLHFGAGPGADLPLAVRVDWAAWAQAVEAQDLSAVVEGWMDAYGTAVYPQVPEPVLGLDALEILHAEDLHEQRLAALWEEVLDGHTR
jgi:hypothetical protein